MSTVISSNLVDRFVTPSSFSSYEDFLANFKINVPENFNFGYDVVDEIARIDPDKTAIVWCDDYGNEAIFSFADVKRRSDKIANFLKSIGIRKGDAVMLMMRRRYEFWFCVVALHKLGAICVPASHLLTARDIVYRNQAADIKMIIAANEERLLHERRRVAGSLRRRSRSRPLSEEAARAGTDLDAEEANASERFERPSGPDATRNDDILILYFTSGTTGMPKMAQHDFTYPLGHILTAKYWQNVRDNGLHFTVADTGWAKAAWGKMYGQWIAGSAVFVYDYDNKFDAKHVLRMIEKHRVTSFCGPATVYRMLIKEDFASYDLSSLKHLWLRASRSTPRYSTTSIAAWGLRLWRVSGNPSPRWQ